ncbi:MAG: response regulator transcription factor [Actinobacteria bacterium]|nr:MAG: response regulator transcription factor [Actinomycetota bacterium]
MALRVVLAEDNYLVREGASALLATADDAAVEKLAPDAVLTDIRMPPSHTDEGIRAALQIRRDHPATGVVVLSQYAEGDYAYALLANGAAGLAYLLKERVANLEEIVHALQTVAAGGSVLDPRVVEELVAARHAAEGSPLAQLTDREREVLAQMAQGKNNAGIARSLFLSERAIEKHINALFHKLGLSEETDVHRRVMAVLAFLRDAP